MSKDIFQIANLQVRFAAYCIDFIILSMLMLLLSSIFTVTSVLCIVNILINCLYFTYFLSSPKQASIGQQIMKIYTISYDYKKITIDIAFDRSISQLLLPIIWIILRLIEDMISRDNELIQVILFAQTIISFLVVLWYAIAIFSNKKQAFHDILFKTVVVTRKVKQ